MPLSRASRWLPLFLAIAVGSVFAADREHRALAAGPEPIAAAPDLTWGFKQSWRGYAGLPLTADGASIDGGLGSYNVKWAFESGTYDPETRTTRIGYSGSVRWRGHKASADGATPPPGYEGEPDPYILDVTLSDPQITISRDESVLTAMARSRDRSTWQMVEFGRVPIVALDVLGVTPTVAGGTTQWPGIPAALPQQGREAFGGFYLLGQALDPVGFSYAGPGGAPDFSEHWDVPGNVSLKLLQNVIFHSGDEAIEMQPPLLIDRENLIVHSAKTVTPSGGGSLLTQIEAFSLKEMDTMGDPLLVPYTQLQSADGVAVHDTSQNRLLYGGQGDSGMPRWLRFNLVTEQYETGTATDPQLSDPSFINPSIGQGLAWDPIHDRGYRVQRIVPDGVAANDYNNHKWKLIIYKEGSGGIWSKESLDLPGFPAGQNQNGYAQTYAQSTPTYATASDGSLIVLASTRTGLASSATIPGAYRLVVDEVGKTVSVQPLPGSNVTNGVAALFAAVQTSANGHVILIRGGGNGNVVHLRIDSGGQIHADAPVSIRDNVEPSPFNEWRYAIDPDSGLVWYGGRLTQKIAAIKDGSFRGAQVFQVRNPRGGPVLVGEDDIVYAQTNDGSPAETGGSSSWGFGKFKHLGYVPTIASQPQPRLATLSVGEAAEEVMFASTASAEPAPDRQWQVKPPGALRFADIEGETGGTLSVDATPGDDGAEYRAVYENAAGRVATDPAALEVSYAPLLLADLANVSATEGSPAEFSVLPDGNPAPTVTWQRRIAGFWENVDPTDENFDVGGASLTVLETNTEQTGALFRAKLTNSLGTVLSKQAKLTVAPKTTIPPGGLDLEGVSLDWTGSAELQKAPPFGGSSYFSSGTSDGDQASYRAIAGNAVTYQVSSGGQESLATWATRAAHIGSGGKQLLRLYGGAGRVEEDGSATIEWDGAFSVNFYGGLVPFTFTDPELTVDEGGDGSLVADLSGYASSQANPSERSPLAPVADVTVATFSGVEVEPGGELAIAPDYAGVEVTVPGGTVPQSRAGAGWGAWPQPFVDFHVQTGLAPYWYSSGGAADPYKAPSPLLLDFEGGAPPAEPGPVGPGPIPASQSGPAAPASIATFRRTQSVGDGRLVRLATVSCPGTATCEVSAPRHVAVWVGGKRYWARVIAPRFVKAGGLAELKLKLPRSARRALAGGTAKVEVPIVVHSGGGVDGWMARVRIRGSEG